MEIMQKTRLEYENGDVSFEEIDESIRVRTIRQGIGSAVAIVMATTCIQSSVPS